MNIMKYARVLVGILIVYNCGSCSKKLAFNNQYLIYTESVKKSKQFHADFFYFIGNDSIYRVGEAFGSRSPILLKDTTNASEHILLPHSCYPYRVRKEHNKVYFDYYDESGILSICRYSLKKNDTTYADVTYKVGGSKYADVFKTVFTGVDTQIYVNGKPINCWKYIELPVYEIQYSLYQIKYVEKTTFVPIKIDNYYYDMNHVNFRTDHYILRHVLERNEVASKEFVLPH